LERNMKVFQFSKAKVVTFLTFLVILNSNQEHNSGLSSRVNSPQQESNTLKSTTATTSASEITYRPQQPRTVKRYLGQVGSDNLISAHTPGWWLYASSEAEARWLDYYGYPTPMEEARLNASTDAELASLVERGDLNAKTHQVTRQIMKTFTEGNVQAMGTKVANARQLLIEGGPYQAFAVYKIYGDMLEAYGAFPASERTPERRAAIDRFDAIAQFGNEIGTTYNDVTFLRLSNSAIQGERERLGLQEIKPATAGQLASGLGGRTAVRSNLGIPTVLLPRPREPDFPNDSPNAVILERY
jgi:hypothetical protein